MTKHIFSFDPQAVPHVSTKHRKIQTDIPAPGTKEVFERLAAVESRSMHGQIPIVWDHAKDFYVFDAQGNKWIDFTSTIFVANVGHANQRVVQSSIEVLQKPLLSCYAYANVKRAEYLEKLINFAGDAFEKAFLLSAGTEATEAAFKLMRMDGQQKKKRRLGVVCLEGNWHGRTLGAQMMSGNEPQRSWIGYQDSDIHHLPFPYPWEMDGLNGLEFFERQIRNLETKGIDPAQDLCGFMLETFQGWGAVFYPNDFVKALAEFCKKHDILLVFDEMQAGFGRTGKRFGYEHYGVKPDLICVGKGIGGGVPLSAVLGRKSIMDLPSVGNMSSTHSANPLVCAAGLAVLEEIESRMLVEETARKGLLFEKRLVELKNKYPDYISDVLGRGLIFALLFKHPLTGAPSGLLASQVVEKCLQKGVLLVHTGRESIKFGPPLVISDEALLEGVDVIDEAMDELVG